MVFKRSVRLVMLLCFIVLISSFSLKKNKLEKKLKDDVEVEILEDFEKKLFTADANLKADQQLVIKLRGNITTGYSWCLDTVDPLLKAMNLGDKKSGEYIEKKQDSERPILGAPGTFVFKFTALNEGKANLVFKYRRSWEKVEPARTAIISITITK